MADSYENVQTGKLKLKKSDKMLAVKGDKKKKRRKKKKIVEEYPSSPPRDVDPPLEHGFVDTRTEAEKRFDKIQREREEKKIDQMAEKSYKERVQGLNSYLDKLPQHFDIPKVGPG
eukprot:CAMPEP_0201508154 /NCGR_PEP_ID=MMETSP0161_2-20130828/1600_1 /ASSEMBLY_ACC=CAM_ASM_000251 /TAXON_ID=180227 /ORGANISM="Neoparamoeba aestuarina, Strain SoJaBio B1-5/56/2" /LENGTH=115 /DNA_ID=CAMNT_0047902723 /DNA_START=23 /DNA_END=370 /DNA_ORIENTATION=-